MKTSTKIILQIKIVKGTTEIKHVTLPCDPASDTLYRYLRNDTDLMDYINAVKLLRLVLTVSYREKSHVLDFTKPLPSDATPICDLLTWISKLKKVQTATSSTTI
jgi:hypothetical protein